MTNSRVCVSPPWKSGGSLEAAASLQVTTAQTINDLERLVPEWQSLWQRDARATPFQSPAWLIPWAKRFTAGDFLCTIARDIDRMVGFLPVFAWRDSPHDPGTLLLLGTGISDYCGGVFDRRGQQGIADAQVAHLQERGGWDLLDFQQLRSDAPLIREASQLEPQSVCPVLTLPASISELGTHVPRAQLQNLAYYRRRAERVGSCVWEIADDESLDRMLEELFALHSMRWAGSNDGAVLDGNLRAFHREAARALLRAGSQRLSKLSVAGETAAVLYALASHGTTFYYLGAFDPKFAHLSPGTLIIGHAIEQAIREGCTHFDFLRGAERYKYLWGAEDTQTFRLRLTRGQ